MFQINLYLETNKLIPPLHSAYRKHHSTETALLHVVDGILTSLDHEDLFLTMLDLSAAFDMLDHQILIPRLGSYFGFSDTVLTHTVVFILLKWALVICHHRGNYIYSSPCRFWFSPRVNPWTSSLHFICCTRPRCSCCE